MKAFDFTHYIEGDQVIIPNAVQSKMATLNLRLKDILWTLNIPMKERQYRATKKYRRVRWFGSY